MMSVPQRIGEREELAELSCFRTDFHGSPTARADAFFELADALPCADWLVQTPVEPSLTAEHRRGYGSRCRALNHGHPDVERLRDLLVPTPASLGGANRVVRGRLAMAALGRGVLAGAAVLPRPRPFLGDRADHPGPAVLRRRRTFPGRSPWTAALDAVRLGPEGDAIAVTAGQLCDVVEHLVRVGQWQDVDRDVLVVDAGYGVMRLAWLLRDLPVELAGRLRSERVLRLPKPPRVHDSKGGRPPKHTPEFRLARPESWPEPAVVTVNDTPRHGKTEARWWDRVHPRLTHRSACIDLDGELPLFEGTLIRLKVDRLPGDRDAPPVWLWSSAADASPSMSTSCGLATFADSTWRTRFACSSRTWARPAPGCANQRRRTAGPGWSSSRVPSSASPCPRPPTSASPGRRPPAPVLRSPRPACTHLRRGDGAGRCSRADAVAASACWYVPLTAKPSADDRGGRRTGHAGREFTPHTRAGQEPAQAWRPAYEGDGTTSRPPRTTRCSSDFANTAAEVCTTFGSAV